MNALQSFGARIVRAVKTLGDPVPGAEVVVGSNVHGRPPVQAWGTDRILAVAASACEVASSCLVFRADAVAKAPLGAFRADGSFDDAHEISRLFARASEGFVSQSDFWHQVSYTLDTSPGGVYVVAPLDRRGLPAALWVRGANDIRPVPDRDSYISGYQMRVDNVWRPVDPALYLVWQHRFVPLDVSDLYGSWPPLHRAARAVGSYEALGKFVAEVLRNKAVLDGFVTSRGKDQPDPATAKLIDAMVQEEFNGPTRAGGIRFLPGDLDLVTLGSTLADVNPGEIEDRLESKISAAFQLNPVSVRSHAGMELSGSLGGDKVEQFIRQDYAGTISALWGKLAGDVAVALAPLYDIDPTDIRFDLSNINELEESEAARIERASKMTGWARINDQLRVAGLEPLGPEGDVIPTLAQLRAFGLLGEEGKAGRGPREVKALRGELLRKAVDDAATAAEPGYATAARKVFAAQRKACREVLAAAEGKAASEAVSAATARRLAKEMEAAVSQLSGMWAEEFTPKLGRSLSVGASAHAGGFGITFDVSRPEVYTAISRRVTKITGKVDRTTVETIRAAMAGVVDEGQTLRDLSAAIETVFDKADGYRAEMIARTESIGAANEGGFLCGKQAQADGLNVVKDWLAFMDEATRPSHILVDTGVPIDEPFTNGLMYPGDPAAEAEEVVNCRCSASFYALGDVSTDPVYGEL